MYILNMAKGENKSKSVNKSSDDEDWKRLEKWHFGRANYN